MKGRAFLLLNCLLLNVGFLSTISSVRADTNDLKTQLTATQQSTISVNVKGSTYPVSPYMTGACMEDLNFEVYGGLYSQMIFGEAFQEPPASQKLDRFEVFGTCLRSEGNVAHFLPGSSRSVVVAKSSPITNGTVAVDIRLSTNNAGASGLLFRAEADQPKNGMSANAPSGYSVVLTHDEVRLNGRGTTLAHFLQKTPADTWVRLELSVQENEFVITIDGKTIGRYTLPADISVKKGGLYGIFNEKQAAAFRHFTVMHDGKEEEISFASSTPLPPVISGMWVPVLQGDVKASYSLIPSSDGYLRQQSQRIIFEQGQGSVGVANEGVNHIGLVFKAGKIYEGLLRVRTPQATKIVLSMEDRSGKRHLGQTSITTRASSEWQKLNFTITSSEDENDGRFVVALEAPGTLDLGYVFLQPGEWGRYKGLPVRKDLAEALLKEGITVIRYGGSMIGSPDYRWKHMLGSRDERSSYSQSWYSYESNGWGIIELLNFCEAAGILCIPALNKEENPQDVADFIEYVNGAAESEWGKRRVADGHPEPYHLKVLEIGNEEHVNEYYFSRFKPLAEAIWAKDPSMILTVGGCSFGKIITDPFHIAPGGPVTSLETHQKILALAKAHNAEVHFDYHIETHNPELDRSTMLALPSFIEALQKLSDGAKFKVVVYEFNAGIHNLSRALSDALAVNVLERFEGKVPVACVANATELDHHYVAYDQGSIFFHKDSVWFQPPAYVTQMIAQNYQPLGLHAVVLPQDSSLDVVAVRSVEGEAVVLRIVNKGTNAENASISLEGFKTDTIQGTLLAGDLKEENLLEDPLHIKPEKFPITVGAQGKIETNVPPLSFLLLRMNGKILQEKPSTLPSR